MVVFERGWLFAVVWPAPERSPNTFPPLLTVCPLFPLSHTPEREAGPFLDNPRAPYDPLFTLAPLPGQPARGTRLAC